MPRAARRETPRAVIVPVITDGIEFTNRYSSDVVKALQEQACALHMVTIGQFYHSEEHGDARALASCSMPAREDRAASASRCSARTGSMTALQRLARSCRRSTRSCTAGRESLIPPERDRGVFGARRA